MHKERNIKAQTDTLPIAARFLQLYMQTGWRGQTRAYFYLAKKMKSLHSVPIRIGKWSPIYMDLRDGVENWLKGTPFESSPWEVAEQNLMGKVVRTDDVVFDIGANIGLHTMLLSNLVGNNGQIFAFEPNPKLFPNLSRTVANLGNVKLFNIALSDETGEAVLFVPEDQMMTSLADWTSADNLAEWRKELGMRKVQTVKCKMRTLDEMIANDELPFPNFIKCDVEGAEFKVLYGGEKTLNREDAPIILFEVDLKTVSGFGVACSTAGDFLAKLSRANYKFFRMEETGEVFHVCEFDFDHANILAVPQSKIERFPL